jgi:hypothetical protein
VTAHPNGSAGVAEAVRRLCVDAEAAFPAGELRDHAAAIRERLEGPLRIAIAGRVKAGKSTLLNALVGERLAPTDAGECTRVVTWYRRGTGYEVEAVLDDGAVKPLGFRRVDGALQVELGTLPTDRVRSIDVRWPASTLDAMTLIDTPGLASLNDANSLRTREFLDHDRGRPSDADAVIYLMRHLHRSDVELLDAFMDRSVPGASPVNAVAVLSRADEIGAARLDALESAAHIAHRYRQDPVIQNLCSTVVPLAGLLAETGLTLREDEFARLRALAALPQADRVRMLLSADHFCDVEATDLTVELRRDLLDRFALYGVRYAIDAIAEARITSATELARALVERSGLGELRTIVHDHFLPRARLLQARSALVALRGLAASARATESATADRIDRDAERLEAGSVEFAQLRVAHLVLSGAVQVPADARSEIERVLLASSPEAALGLTAGAGTDEVRRAALTGIERWRTRATDPVADPGLVETCETVARTYEGIFAAATAG